MRLRLGKSNSLFLFFIIRNNSSLIFLIYAFSLENRKEKINKLSIKCEKICLSINSGPISNLTLSFMTNFGNYGDFNNLLVRWF